MKIFCLIKKKYISEQQLRKTRRRMRPLIINMSADPLLWSEKLMERGKFRVEFDNVSQS